MGTTRLGVIGLGLMGSSMARLNVAAGHTVKGFDVNPDRADLIEGLSAACSVAEAATDVDVILLSLPNSGIGLEVTLGDGEPQSRQDLRGVPANFLLTIRCSRNDVLRKCA